MIEKLFLSMLPLLVALCHSQEIFYDGFKEAQANLSLNKGAHIKSNGLLRLTNRSSRSIGHAFYSSPLRIKASPSSPVLSFSTVFAFAMVPRIKKHGGHGIAFIMSTDKSMDGALPSQYLGILNSADDGDLAYQVFAVEFDIVQDFEFEDIDDNHVGININSMRSSASTPAGYYVEGKSTLEKLNLQSEKIIFAWIDYDSSNNQINVGLSLSYRRPKKSILSFGVNLSLYLDEFVYVGFSASTGLLASSHYILGWSFSVDRQARLLQPSQLRQLSSPNPKEMKRRHISQHAQLHIVAISASLLIFSLTLFSLWFCNYKMKTKQQVCEEDVGDFVAVESLHMEFNMIRAATQNFSSDRKLRQGGFGHVYKGTLENGQDVAVKRLSRNSGQGIAEFKTEVLLVAKLQHRNLVRLLGFCISRKEKILVYEFLPNSSLDKLLFDPTKRTSLNWETRFKIIYGIAKGLLYIHEDSHLKVVHRDLKSSNVLLDEAMNPKISDFGLAKLLGVDQTQDATNTIVGTYGYMAPEYIFTGRYSVKSDIYSFGIMVLEIVNGQRNNMNRLHHEEEALLHRAWRLWNESATLNLVDETLGDNFSREQVMKCIQIGLLCIQEHAAKRPNMTPVVAALGGQAVTLPMPSPPAFFGPSGSTSTPNAVCSASVRKFSDITELHPR